MGNKNKSIYLIPVMLCFFCMGFVDLVGIASNYVKEDLALTDSVANVLGRQILSDKNIIKEDCSAVACCHSGVIAIAPLWRDFCHHAGSLLSIRYW